MSAYANQIQTGRRELWAMKQELTNMGTQFPLAQEALSQKIMENERKLTAEIAKTSVDGGDSLGELERVFDQVMRIKKSLIALTQELVNGEAARIMTDGFKKSAGK